MSYFKEVFEGHKKATSELADSKAANRALVVNWVQSGLDELIEDARQNKSSVKPPAAREFPKVSLSGDTSDYIFIVEFRDPTENTQPLPEYDLSIEIKWTVSMYDQVSIRGRKSSNSYNVGDVTKRNLTAVIAEAMSKDLEFRRSERKARKLWE